MKFFRYFILCLIACTPTHYPELEGYRCPASMAQLGYNQDEGRCMNGTQPHDSECKMTALKKNHCQMVLRNCRLCTPYLEDIP